MLQTCEKRPFPASLDTGIFIVADKDLGLVLGKRHKDADRYTQGQVIVEWNCFL